MTDKEKQILESFGKAIPKMTEEEKERLLMAGELIAMICDRSAPDDTGQEKSA